ncbi:hypothetical protein [Nocardiopsis synnemataformans]|uniref:hypothetical protein n=1 Tax=Nocardiopsis synnemataformans TaxID=61305 RepID=UPI003EC04858
MTGPELPAAIRYLPLVPRPRPAALPLQRRLTELDELVHQAQHAHGAEEGMARACEAMNKAALLASDTGHPDLAATLCWRQYEAFLPAAPLTVKAATFALQPLVNLARLAIRTGNPSDAYTLLESLLAAADQAEPAQLLGRTCPVGGLVACAAERAELRQFLWAVLLADGTRALCAAGRWQDAVDHLHRYNGIGTRLLDGRQVAVLAALHRTDPGTATRLLATTDCAQAWEHAVAACLTTATRLASGQDSSAATTAMVNAVLHLPPTPGGAVFAARLGVLACELAPEHRALLDHVLFGVLQSDDAHTATAALGSPVVAPQLAKDQQQALRARVARAELAENEEPFGVDARLDQVCAKAARFLT